MGSRNNNGCCESVEEEVLGVEDRSNRSCRCYWKGFERGFVQGVNCANNRGCGCRNNWGCNGCGF